MAEHPKVFIQLPDIPTKFESAYDAYSVAFDIARAGDVLGWRQLIKRIKPNIFNSLVEWRENELDGQQPESKEQLVQVVDKAVDIMSPLISVALVGVESGREQFRDQKSIIYDLLNIDGWNRYSGHQLWRRIPHALEYAYHSLHGSLSLITNQLDIAFSLAQVKIPIRDGTEHLHLWEREAFMGWSESISGTPGGNCKEGWKYLAKAFERWKWLSPIFGNDLEYRTSLVAYYMALSIHELAKVIALGKQDALNTSSKYYFKVPLTFVSEGFNINERAIALLLRNPKSLMELWTSLNVTREQMEYSWRSWIHLSERWLQGVYGPSFDTRVSHQYLFEVL